MRPRLGFSLWLLAAGCGAVLVAGPGGARADDDPPGFHYVSSSPGLSPEQLQNVLPYLSNAGMRTALARSLGLREFAGKPLYSKFGAGTAEQANEISAQRADPASDFDHMVTGDTTSILGQQRNPSVGVNPVDQSIVVVVAENTKSITGNVVDCSLYLSRDGGESYTYLSDTPLFAGVPHRCASPKLAYSPDGLVIYVTYLDTGTNTNVIMAKYDGFSPGGASGFIFGGNFDSPSIGVHTWYDGSAGGADALYMTYIDHNAAPACSVILYRFANYMGTLSGQVLATTPNCTGVTPLLTRPLLGPAVAGGPGQQVLACWFDAGVDGYSTTVQFGPPVPPTPVAPLNKFNIACRSSNDRGVTFTGGVNPPELSPPAAIPNWIYAAKNVVAELPYWLGPNGVYFFIAPASSPSVAIDFLGNAHVAFSYNPAATNRFKSESANVGYVKSTNGLPTLTIPTIYSKWSPKSVVAPGAGAQLFPTVVTQRVHESGKPYVYVGWLDTSASTKLGVANANIIYDARYRVSTTGGPAFGKPIVASDHASTSDFGYVGTYTGAGAGAGIFHFVWTDNRFSFSPAVSKEHIFGDRN